MTRWCLDLVMAIIGDTAQQTCHRPLHLAAIGAWSC
jgi:hypothetical protein